MNAARTVKLHDRVPVCVGCNAYEETGGFSANPVYRSSLGRIDYERPLCGMLLAGRYSRFVPSADLRVEIVKVRSPQQSGH